MKDSSFRVQLFVLIFISVGGAIFSSLLFYLFILLKGGFSMEALENPSILYQNPETLRMMLFFSSIGSFFFPALVLSSLFSDNEKVYLQMKEYSSFKMTFYVILSMLVLQPFVNFMAEINGMIQLPESMKMIEEAMLRMENEAKQTTEMILHTRSILILIFNIIIIGIFAAVSEEFFFRGVLQNIFRKIFRNEHLVIWIVAIIFSAIHFQFYGFIPRMLLGAYFGYLLYYTKNIWAPVLAHFVNNAIGVISYFILLDTNELDSIDSIGAGCWWLSLLSLLFWGIIFAQIVKVSNQQRSEN